MLNQTFRDNLYQKVLAPDHLSTMTYLTQGTVIDADEMNNTCTISYLKNGKRRNIKNVAIRLYGNGTDYFPKKGDNMIVEVTPATCSVIARDVSNFAMDVLSGMELVHDIFSDYLSSVTTGEIC